VHHTNINAPCRGTARQYTRSLNWIARDASSSRVIATRSCRKKPERHAAQRLNATLRVRPVHRLATRTVAAEHKNACGASINRLKRRALRWPLQTRLRHEHIKWTERRELLKDAIECTRGTTATCGGINDEERVGT
jgi:hypothetical protein